MREPAFWISVVAVFGPTPGTPGMLSLASPLSASTSRMHGGGTPHFLEIASGPSSVKKISGEGRSALAVE